MIHTRLLEGIKSTYLKRSTLAAGVLLLFCLCISAHNTWATYVSSDSVGAQGIQSAQYEVVGTLYMLSGETEERVSTVQTPDENGVYSMAAGNAYQFKVHAMGNVSTGYCVLDFNQGTVCKYLTLVPSETETIVNILPAADCSFSYSYSWGSAPEDSLAEGTEYTVQTGEAELAKVAIGTEFSIDETKNQTKAEDLNDPETTEEGTVEEPETTKDPEAGEETNESTEGATDITNGEEGSSGNESGAADNGTGSGGNETTENTENTVTTPEGAGNNQVDNTESTDNSAGNAVENSSQPETGTVVTNEESVETGTSAPETSTVVE